jgi:hypothetical protein
MESALDLDVPHFHGEPDPLRRKMLSNIARRGVYQLFTKKEAPTKG